MRTIATINFAEPKVNVSVSGNNIQKMKDAATDCSDNMGSDVYSQKAIAKLETCAKDLQKTLNEASELRKKILNKKKQIEDSYASF